MEVVEADWALARELGIRINIHLGQGIFPGRPAVGPMLERSLLGDDVTFGHCNLLTDGAMKLMAEHGVTATVTPEDEANMGHGYLMIETADVSMTPVVDPVARSCTTRAARPSPTSLWPGAGSRRTVSSSASTSRNSTAAPPVRHGACSSAPRSGPAGPPRLAG